MLFINNLLLLFTFAVCSSTACTKELNEKPKVTASATEQVEPAEGSAEQGQEESGSTLDHESGL